MKLPYSKESDIVIKEANRVARKLGQNFVGSEHFIVALASVADTTAYSILNENGLDIVKIIDALKYTLEPGGVVTGERDKYTMSARGFSMTHSMRREDSIPRRWEQSISFWHL